MISSQGLSRAQLRKQLRQLRRDLPASEQRLAAQQLYRQLSHHPTFRRSKHIALYLANDGEINPQHLLKAAQKRGKQVYLPVLRRWPKTHMDFQPLKRYGKLARNRFGIAEPVYQPRLRRPAWALDLLCLPLVGFDAQGQRLGMGGGFYDRALSYLKRRQHWRSPSTYGLAHQCQQVDRLEQAQWDIPLDAIITPKKRYQAR